VDHEFKNFDGQKKAICRNLATVNVGCDYKRPVFLPGAKLLCVKQAIANGITNPSYADFSLVERSPGLRKTICDQARQLGLKYKLVDRDVTLTHFNPFKPENQGLPLVDYMFCDLCSTCMPEVVRWNLSSSREWLSPTARLAFTFCGKTRSGVPWFKKVMSAYDYEVPEGIYRSLAYSANNWCNRLGTREDRQIPMTEFMKVQFLLLVSSLPYEFQLRDSLVYKDSPTPMVFYHGIMTGRPNPYNNGKIADLVKNWFTKRRSGVIRPYDMSAQEWAWSAQNPKGIRVKRFKSL